MTIVGTAPTPCGPLSSRRNDTVAGKRAASMRCSGVRWEGAMAWATCQGEDNHREIRDPSLFQETLTRDLGPHDDRDVPFDGERVMRAVARPLPCPHPHVH